MNKKSKYLILGAILASVIFLAVAATFQNVWTTNPFPGNYLNITNLGANTVTASYQLTTNSFYVYGVASANFNGTYVWNNTSQTYTNVGTGSYCYFLANDPNLGTPGWFITNVTSHLWDDFDTDVPSVIGGSENKFPILPLLDGTLVYTVNGYNIAFWLPTNSFNFNVYEVQSTSPSNFVGFTNPVVISGENPSIIVGNNNFIQTGSGGAYLGNPSAILGSFNNREYGFNSIIGGGHDNTNYGEGSAILGSAGNMIVKNTGEDGLLGCELSVWNNAGGNSGGCWDLFCTNNGANQSGMVGCFNSTSDGQSVIGHCIMMLSSEGSYMNIQHGVVSGYHGTNVGYGVYSFGDFNQVNIGLSFGNVAHVLGNSNVVTANNTTTIGNGQVNSTANSVQIGYGSGNGVSMRGTNNVFVGAVNSPVIFSGSITNTNNIQTATINATSGIKYTAGTLASGNVLTSDASGNASWATPTSAALGYGVVTTNAGAVTLTNGNGGTIVLATNLPAGDWDVEAVVSYSGSGVTMVPGTGNSANLSTNASYSTAELQTVFVLTPTITLGNDAFSVTLPSYRVSNSVPTLVMARTSLLFTAGTVTCSGKMTCRQVH